jgi:hypothetical protein
MNERTEASLDWHPTEDEVRAIVEEMRPLLVEMAARERQRLGRICVSLQRARRHSPVKRAA